MLLKYEEFAGWATSLGWMITEYPEQCLMEEEVEDIKDDLGVRARRQ